LHFSQEVRIVELVRVANALVGLQFQIRSAEGVALAGGEIGEPTSGFFAAPGN